MSERKSSPRRAAALQLSDLRSAGVTHLLRRSKSELQPDVAQVATVDSGTPKSIEAATLDGGSTSRFDAKRSAMPRPERQDRLCALAAKVAGCTRCTELAETRKQTVFGVGNPEAQIMFVGEAPGADEDRLGEPFVGAGGQLLNKILQASRLKREEVYICNILRCRPPGNRTPTIEEAANCREYLEGQIEIVDPGYIVCLGSVAAKNLLGSMDSIGKLRGRFLFHGRAKVLCTYHPAYLLRNPAAKKEVWQDMKFLMRELGVDLDDKTST